VALGAPSTTAAKTSDDRQTRIADTLTAENLEGERKLVTALFADMKGSMELIEDLDPEEARAIVDPALKLMIDAVQRYGGYVAQSTGDGIFALFGPPVAHEDHRQRSLNAAVHMPEEPKYYSDRIRAKGRLQSGRSRSEHRRGASPYCRPPGRHSSSRHHNTHGLARAYLAPRQYGLGQRFLVAANVGVVKRNATFSSPKRSLSPVSYADQTELQLLF
jgi:Adenylate and Guanylate cyclase catalytic domain